MKKHLLVYAVLVTMIAFAACFPQTANANLEHDFIMKEDASIILGYYPQGNRKLKVTSMDESRFAENIKKTDGCWLWTGTVDSDGYGNISINCWPVKAHRLSFFLKHGRFTKPCVCHKCDVRLCVNPDHLFEGTPRDNILDMEAKGRGVRVHGSKHKNSKLQDADVTAIRNTYASGGISQKKLASDYGVSQAQISLITQGLRWAHISHLKTPPPP